MGTLIFAVSALLQAALFSICSLALSQDGTFRSLMMKKMKMLCILNMCYKCLFSGFLCCLQVLHCWIWKLVWMIARVFLVTGMMVMKLHANGLVFLAMQMTKQLAQCMYLNKESFIKFLGFFLVMWNDVVNLNLECSLGLCRNLPYMQLGGFISPIIGKLRRLERL